MSKPKVSESLRQIRALIGDYSPLAYDLALQLEQDHARLTREAALRDLEIAAREDEHARLVAQVAELQAVINASESTNAVNQLVMAMNKKVNDLIAERDELQKQLDARWQSISTAPEDGTIILYSGRYEGPPWVSCGRWTDHGWYDINVDDSDTWGHAECPTHWQPLPAPPKETK